MPFGARKNIGLFLGVIIFIIGLLGVLSGINVLGFKIPLTMNIIAWILAIGGIYLIFESFTEIGMRRTSAIILAIFLLLISLIPILNQLGAINLSIPIVNLLFYHILLVIEGIFLIINAFGT